MNHKESIPMFMSVADMFGYTKPITPSTVYSTVPTVNREAKNRRQNDRILMVFAMAPHTDFTPFEVSFRLGQQYPITSVRRGITDLTKAGFLVKTDKCRKGIYGETNHTWKLNTGN